MKERIRSILLLPLIRRAQLSRLLAYLRADGQSFILDVGCGGAYLTHRIAAASNARVVGMDISLRALHEGSRFATRAFALVNGDGCNLPFRSETVPLVLLSSVLQMLPNPGLLLSECRRVLTRSGMLVLSVPSDYLYIKPLYATRKKRLAALLLSALRMPPTYDHLTRRLNTIFDGGGCGYYSFQQLDELLRNAGFTIDAHSYCPGPIGSLIWEMGVLASHRLGGSPFPLLLISFLYPLATLDLVLEKLRPPRGCEIIARARKS